MKIFWSYASRDDMGPGKVSRLRRAFEIELGQARGEDCRVVSGASDLSWGSPWRKQIETLIGTCDGLVAIVTPSYFNSRMCIFELKMAEAAGKEILPILYRDCPRFESGFKEDGVDADVNSELNQASRAIGERHRRDFRELRTEPLDSPAVERFLSRGCAELARRVPAAGS